MSSQVKRLESLLEAMPDALVGTDKNGVIHFVNRQTETLFGYDRDDLVGLPVTTLVPETLSGIYEEHQDDDPADPRTPSLRRDLELTGQKRDGRDVPVRVHLSYVDTGDVLVVIGAAAEETKKDQALETAARMMAIVENCDDAILGLTLDGVITSCNSAAERVYGWTRQETVGMSIDSLTPDDRPREMMKAVLANIRRGVPVDHFETVRLRKDGGTIRVSLRVSPIRDAGGVIVGASSIARDVTQERQAFQAARAMIESSLDSLVAISPEGLITDLNEATVNVTGVSREELLGTSFSQCFTDPEKADEVYQRVFAEGAVTHYPLTIRHPDGTLTEVLYNASVYRDPGGEALGVFAAARDVSEVRRAFEATRSMIESSLDALVAISPDGMITDVNEATIKVTGVPRGELIGTAFSDYFTDPEKAHDIYERVFADGMAVDYSLTMRHREGALTEVLYNASVYRDAAGEVLGVFAAARDVTKQRQAQEELALQRREELDRLAELERIHRVTVGRELKMIELKTEIQRLNGQLQMIEGDTDDQPQGPV